MVPVAVSVPTDAEIKIKMQLASWAFGDIVGTPMNH